MAAGATTIKGAPAPTAFAPTDQQVVQLLQQRAVFDVTNRYARLDRKEAFARAMEYDHQQTDWWGDRADALETISPEALFPAGTTATGGESPKKTAREKRPTAPTRKAKTTTQRFTDMLFSSQRIPKLLVEQDPDTEDYLDAVRDAGRFWRAMRIARNKGGGMGSVMMTVHVVESRWVFEVHNAKYVAVKIWKDKRNWSLRGVLLMYRTLREEAGADSDGKPDGSVRQVEYLVRRIITENDDIRYAEVKVDEAKANPAQAWTIDPQLSMHHGLGAFPGTWIQNIADEEDEDGGGADCEGAFESIDANDRLIAQANYATIANCDPTVVTSTDPKAVSQVSTVAKGSDYAMEVGVGGNARYMEMTGAGVELALKLSDKLEGQIDEITGAVFPDDQDVANSQSAKAIELRFAPMISRCDDLRGQYGDAIVEIMKIVVLIGKKAEAPVQLPDDEGGQARIGKFKLEMPMRRAVAADGQATAAMVPQKLGLGGYMSLKWGPYFPPTENDIKDMIQNSTAAMASRLVTQITSAARVAPLFGVTDVEAEVAAANAESQEQAERALAGFEGGVKMERTVVEGTQSEQADGDGENSPGAGQGGKP